jgi:hypothetical protein
MLRLLGFLGGLVGWTMLPARPFTAVVYNVENLFDVDGVSGYDEYQPTRYTPAHALTKLRNIARVLAQYEGGRGPDLVLLSEIEVDATPGAIAPDYDAILARYAGTTLERMLGSAHDRAIADLPAEALLLKALADAGLTGYRVVLGDNVTAPGSERDKQSIRCAVLTRFPVVRTQSHATLDARAILEVELEIDGARLHVFANHWKSGASDPKTEPTRIANARTLRTRIDALLRADPQADILIGGDLNSQYNQQLRYPEMKATAIDGVLGAQGRELAVRGPDHPLYNLWYELPEEQRGSDTYRGEWGTLMHLIVSRGLYDHHGIQYVDNSFTVGRFTGLNADASGLPVRWTFDGRAGAGFSDHFPLSARFQTVTDGRRDRYVVLTNPSEGRTSGKPRKTIDYAAMDLARLAVRADTLPAGANLRTEAFKGKIFRVEGRVAPGPRFAIEFRGETFDLWSPDRALFDRLRAAHPAGAPLRFYGELGVFRDRWQFVIQDASWVK